MPNYRSQYGGTEPDCTNGLQTGCKAGVPTPIGSRPVPHKKKPEISIKIEGRVDGLAGSTEENEWFMFIVGPCTFTTTGLLGRGIQVGDFITAIADETGLIVNVEKQLPPNHV
jgi:hypothetical protein